MIRYLFIPETGPGKGSGHLVRCLELASLLPDAAFLIPTARRDELLGTYPALAGFPVHDRLPELAPLPDGQYPVVVFDLMRIEECDVTAVLPAALPVAIDGRGPGLRLMPFVVDLLPRIGRGPAWAGANLNAPEFLPQPATRREGPATSLPERPRVLVSFGGEDAAGLGRRLADSGVLASCLPGAAVDLLCGPLCRTVPATLPDGWRRLEAVPKLRDSLHAYDLVVTSFGLTAHEARAAGCRVALYNPSRYHERLSAKSGFGTIGLGRPRTAALARLLVPDPGGFSVKGKPGPAVPAKPTAPDANVPGPEGLAALMKAWPKDSPCACPGCRATNQVVSARFADRTYFRCATCGLDFLVSFRAEAMAYGDAYFFTDYQKQYGRTYLDDFEHIKGMGRERLDCLDRVAGGLAGKRLLDVGCAYGPFLAAARDRGMTVIGTDISPGAVAHVRDGLGIPALAGDFRRLSVAELGGPFDAVSLWYVIEHFPDLHVALGCLNRLLLPGGFLALSTPSGEGISARRDRHRFLECSPADHFTVWNPSWAARLLALYGFRLERIRVTGHHPERFPGILGSAALRPLAAWLSRRLGLGDTFELYARKTSGIPAAGTSANPASSEIPAP
jgi:2-polyprenyl-3-methyl-5-hydroxy-6-metoxy-1,4-benzoquinol methylase